MTHMQTELDLAQRHQRLYVFDGETYDRKLDCERLSRLLDRVREFTVGTGPHTLAEIHSACGGTEASCSARLRDLRKEGYEVVRVRVKGGLYTYEVKRKEDTCSTATR